ncbi:MAG: DUF1501 domain-containing protein [Planctomycetaceae bacterium]
MHTLNQVSLKRISRRQTLQVGVLGGLGISLPHLLAQKESSAASPPADDVNCIVIWTRGGTSHHDTMDPKPNATASVKGEFGLIPTAVPGVHFTEIVPRLAQNLPLYSLLRGWNPRNGSHGTADQWVLSGRQFNPALTYPTYGAVVSHQKGFRSKLPPYVQLGGSIDARYGGGTAGILGMEHNPFVMLADPNAQNFEVRDIMPPKGINGDRISRRRNMLSVLGAHQTPAEIQPSAFTALDKHYSAALNMITAPETKRAFLMDEEDPKLRDRYGRNTFGQSCLLARRLIQSGVRFVTVTDGGWDTHQDNFKSLKDRLIPRVDQGLCELLIDLQNQGMLEKTLVCWFTDFGRTPNINSASGRDHWSSSGFAIMAGAGVPGGMVLGATSDDGGQVTNNEYYSDDLAATIYYKLGMPLDLMVTAPDGRPIRLIEGRAIDEWI